MRKPAVLIIVSLSMTGCAYVPPLESEKTFSYAEIINQIQCETYDAVEHINSIPGPKPGESLYDWAHLENWSMGITLTTSVFVDAEIGVGATRKTKVGKTGDFFQWALGGGTSPGGVNIEGLGTSTATNKYQLNISSLYMGKMIDGKFVANVPHHRSKYIDCLTTLPTEVPANVFSGGIFGIDDFLERSLAAVANRTVQVTTLGYTREYKDYIRIGVTPGWYAALGNTSPNVGGYANLDDIVGLVFNPPAPAATPNKITEVRVVNFPAAALTPKIRRRPGTPTAVAPAPSAPARTPPSLRVAPVPQDQSDRLLQQQNNNLTNQLLRSVNPLLQQ